MIVDAGGRDIKIIVLKHGRVKDFRLNTQCSAGHGYFLQAIAQNRGIPVERSGTPFFAFKNMDENRPAGSIKLRLETIGHSLRRHQERLAQLGRFGRLNPDGSLTDFLTDRLRPARPLLSNRDGAPLRAS